MSWIFFAAIGYVLAAVTFLLDKYIIKSRIPEPSVYAFFVGLFSLFAFALIPVLGGFRFFGLEITLVALLSGIMFIFGLVALYKAIKEGEISRVAPMVGAVIPAFALLLSMCGCILEREPFEPAALGALLFFMIGGLLLALEFPFRKRVFFKGFSYVILAGIFLALFFVLFKYIGEYQNFTSAFVWARLGMMLGAFSLLLYVPFRERILKQCCNFHSKKQKKRTVGTLGYFVLNKILGGLSYLAVGYAIFLGPVVIIQAMASVQYAFVILFVFLAGFIWPDIFRERYRRGVWIQKTLAVVLIAIGIMFVAQIDGVVSL